LRARFNFKPTAGFWELPIATARRVLAPRFISGMAMPVTA
jgi:hypothetical protein